MPSKYFIINHILMPARNKTNFLYKSYLNVTSSMAFLPTIIAVSLFFMALATLSMDQFTPESVLSYKLQIKNIIYPDSARALLGAIAGGTISLVVFSFSMVMVVLNQTASNYTPRVLPSLIGNKFHQVIMGIYLGTIVYTFMVLASIQSKIYAFEVPSLSILINALLSLICLALFLAFVRSISEKIQIGNIINRLYEETCSTLELNMKKELHVKSDKLPDTAAWALVCSPVAGYFDSINERQLLKTTKTLNITIRLLVPFGSFINQRDPFFYVSRQLNDEEKEEIFQLVVMRHQEIVKQNYLYGFKQLTEIAVKALSPGINDPGTAIQAIDRLTDLMVIHLGLKHDPILLDDKKNLRVIYKAVQISELFYFCFSSIRNYTTKDMPVILKLLRMIKTVYLNDDEKVMTATLAAALQDSTEHFLAELSSEGDKKRFIQMLHELLQLMEGNPDLSYLSHKINALKKDAE